MLEIQVDGREAEITNKFFGIHAEGREVEITNKNV